MSAIIIIIIDYQLAGLFLDFLLAYFCIWWLEF